VDVNVVETAPQSGVETVAGVTAGTAGTMAGITVLEVKVCPLLTNVTEYDPLGCVMVDVVPITVFVVVFFQLYEVTPVFEESPKVTVPAPVQV
jgi:hypothetical protein